MLEIEKWAQGKPTVVALIAQNLATGADSAHKMLSRLQENTLFLDKVELPDLDDWLSLYKKPRRIFASILDLVGASDEIKGSLFDSSLLDSLVGNFITLINEDSEEVSFTKIRGGGKVAIKVKESELAQDFQKQVVENFDQEISDPPQPAPMDGWLELASKPEFNFLIRIYIPCWLCYHKSPLRLLRDARHRDTDSLDKLMRLDKSVLSDKLIANYIHELSVKKPHKYKTIMESLFLKTPKIEMLRIKYFIAGSISFTSDFLGQRLTAADIRSLFDAIAKDKCLGDVDTDLPDDIRTFKKAIQREIPFWNQTYSGDTKM